MRIALLEDDRDQAELMKLWIEDAGHQCIHFESGTAFLRAFKRDSYDLLVLDWMLPESSGLEVLEWVRAHQDWPIPVLFVTQRDEEEDIVRALEKGADDYMAKPVKQLEMLARIAALGRRGRPAPARDQGSIDLPPYRIDLVNHRVTVAGEEAKLTQKEYELCVFLFKNLGRVVSRSHLLQSVWGTSPDINTRTIDTHMSRIRSKLAITPESGWRLTSVYQHGYRLEQLGRT